MTVELVQSAAGRTFVDLVDSVPQLMASLKDPGGRYAYVNSGFSQRVGLPAHRVVGLTVWDLFSSDLAQSYVAQDEAVLSGGRPLRSSLELIVRADRTLGWYMTNKSAVREAGTTIGVAALSVDLHSQLHSAHAGLAAAIAAIRADVAHPWRVGELADVAGLTRVQLERRCRSTLGIAPQRLVQRIRIEHAVHLITTTDATIGSIAHGCGFYDQSSFTRQFRALLGLTPGAYRAST